VVAANAPSEDAGSIRERWPCAQRASSGVRDRAESAERRDRELGAGHASTVGMQPPADHLSYDYPHDEILDRPRRSWSILLIGMLVAMVALFVFLIR
jgi:hypothetical protein